MTGIPNVIPETAFIYGLIDPETGAVRYVGETIDPVKRAKWHWYNRRYDAGNMALKNWLRSLKEAPELLVFMEVPYETRYSVERLWTLGLRKIFGDLLLNMNDGAQPGAETRARHLKATTTAEHRARSSVTAKAQWARKKATGEKPFIDLTPALEARAMGFEMTNMAVLHESVNGSMQNAPVHEMTRQQVYVKVMAALRLYRPEYVMNNGGMGSPAAFREHTKDMVVSLPDDIVLHLADLWDDGLQEACAAEYMECMRALVVVEGLVTRIMNEINKEAA